MDGTSQDKTNKVQDEEIAEPYGAREDVEELNEDDLDAASGGINVIAPDFWKAERKPGIRPTM